MQDELTKLQGESPLMLPTVDFQAVASVVSPLLGESEVPGLYTIVYDSGRNPLELDAAKFEEYLKDEGLETDKRVYYFLTENKTNRCRSTTSSQGCFQRLSNAWLIRVS